MEDWIPGGDPGGREQCELCVCEEDLAPPADACAGEEGGGSQAKGIIEGGLCMTGWSVNIF